MKLDLYPEKAQYIKNQPIKVFAEFDTPITKGYQGVFIIYHLQTIIFKKTLELSERITEINLDGIDSEFSGYGIELLVYEDGCLIVKEYTAFDVVSACNKAIRYGFLSDFNTEDKDCSDIRNLRKYHINMVQYYDWSYRHDDLVAKTNQYSDMMGREVDLDTVREKIKTCRQYGMKSIGYGAVYAASNNFYNKHKEWGLYCSTGEPLVFIDTFYIMNISKDCKWREHIIEEYAKAIKNVGFDGIHMDTYGFPKTAYSIGKEKLIKLDEEYPTLIEDTKKRLNQITTDNYLIFNNVGNWPVKSVAKSPQDAMYIEVWDPYVSYNHIKQIILDARRECEDKKPVILAAYLKPFKNENEESAPFKIESENSAPFKNENEESACYAALILTATITVNGAYHLLLGEENGVLTQGYYVEHSFLSETTASKLRTYYDFLVQYMELFYDTTLIDVSMTHIGWDNTEYHCLSNNWSVDAKEDKIWITIRENENRKLISLINLCGCKDNLWNYRKNKPEEKENIKLQVQIDKDIKGLYFISPDYEHGKVQEISYELIKTDRGWISEFVVPKLELWSTVWIDF